MANLQLVSATPSSLNVRIANLSFPARDYHEFRFRVNGGSWISTGKPTNTDHNSPTVNLWTGSSDCPASVEAISFYGTGSVNFSATFTTEKQPAPTISTNSSTSNSVSVSWTSVAGATDYRLQNMTTGGIITVYGTSHTWTGLSANTSYTFRVYANVTGNCSTYTTGWSNSATLSTTAPPPTPPAIPSYLLANPLTDSTNVSTSWVSVSGATQYRLEFKRSTISTWSLWTTTTNTWSTVSNLWEYTDYDFRVRAENSGGNSDWRYNYSNKTADLTNPTVTILGFDTSGRIHFRWESSDPAPVNGVASGIRSTNGHAVYISKKNNTTLGTGIYLSGSTFNHSFTTDADGLAFENDATYTVRVRSIDTFGNWSTSADRNIIYKSSRPPNWSWTTAKTSGIIFNATATEWNNFCLRINEFRQYKNLAVYSFTSAVKGQNALASQINQARTAINAMSPPTTVPTTVSNGGQATAATMNGLRDSLNSIL